MTTIAWDGKTLATDSLITSGNTAFGVGRKLFKLKGGKMMAFAGRMDVALELIDWLNGGETPDLDEEDRFSALIVDKDGKAFEVNNSFRIMETCAPWAGGAGESFALAALYLGKNAVEAVELACRLDVNSRGPVQSAELGARKKWK